MLAEHTADPGDASSPWPKPKCWDVTSSSGFALWKLNIEAMISSDEAVQLGHDEAYVAPVPLVQRAVVCPFGEHAAPGAVVGLARW